MTDACWRVTCLSPDGEEKKLILRRGLTWEEACDFFEDQCLRLPQLQFLLEVDQDVIAREIEKGEEYL